MRKEKTNYSVENLVTLLKYCQILISCGQRWHTAILVRLGLKGDGEEGQGCTRAPLLMQRHFNTTSKREHVCQRMAAWISTWFQEGSERRVGANAIFQGAGCPCYTPAQWGHHHLERLSLTAARLHKGYFLQFSQRLFLLGEGGTQEHTRTQKISSLPTFFYFFHPPKWKPHVNHHGRQWSLSIIV